MTSSTQASESLLHGRSIVVSGARGLLGSSLTEAIESRGGKVIRLARTGSTGRDATTIVWNPDAGDLSPTAFRGVDSVVHLAGENIAGGRWTAAKKQRIRDSRIVGTRRLCESLAAMTDRPRTLICASAIGFYGDNGDKKLTEVDGPGKGFLPEVCREWEQATEPARAAGIRVVNLRIGVVLSKEGGALKEMLLPFRLGAGGRIGSGGQYWSWISLHDMVRVITFALENERLSGPVNAVAPNAVTNLEFTKTLGGVLHRPTIFPMPAFVARLVLGEMANDLLLASLRVVPDKLLKHGFEFDHADLRTALTAALSTASE